MTRQNSTSLPEGALPQKTHDFSVAEYYQMAEVFEGQRVELLRGKIVDLSPIKSRHAAAVKKLLRLLSTILPPDYILSVQDPVRLSEFSEPEPDLSVLRSRQDFYASAHPGPKDILLLVEVADTSLDKDRRVKLPLYAEAGVPEYWIVDLTADRLEVYTRPEEGSYAREVVLKAGDRLEHELLGELEIEMVFPDRD